MLVQYVRTSLCITQAPLRAGIIEHRHINACIQHRDTLDTFCDSEKLIYYYYQLRGLNDLTCLREAVHELGRSSTPWTRTDCGLGPHGKNVRS